MLICLPVSYPVGKILDYLLGHNDSGMFRRTQLKALVGIHGEEAGKGGDLSHDETTIIQGALDLTSKRALDAMTPLESTFALDLNSKLDWETIQRVLARGHSRVPIYDGDKRNLVGLLLVKTLLSVRAEDEVSMKQTTIRKIPRVPSDMPLYDILNEFQKGSHMAAVTKVRSKIERSPSEEQKDDKHPQGMDTNIEADLEKGVQVDDSLRVLKKAKKVHESELYSHVDAGEVIGIITLEDVMEELLQEEIVDETDEYIDVANRVRVAAAAAHINRGASLVRGISSFKNPQVAVSKQGQDAINKGRQNRLAQLGVQDDNNNLSEPLLDDK
jgi:metal transporter CNNM